MGKSMERVRDLLCDELEKISSKGELTAGSLETIDKLTHSIKSIDTIMAMDDAGYSKDYMPAYGARSYAGQRRDSMGRYSRNSYRRGYSYDEAKDDMIDQLEGIMQTAPDKRTKDAIRKAIEAMEE